MWEIYDAILAGLPSGPRAARALSDDYWTLVVSDEGGYGLAMTTAWDQRPPLLREDPLGLPLRKVARTVKSWNLREAGFGMAAANAYYNTPARVAALGAEEPYENYCTAGLDFSGKTVGVVGHLKMPPDTLRAAKEVFILERHPQPGDYPDSACEFLLPGCDIVLITGSALVNKTLPRLLQLCRRAYTILTGPTVPLCPALLSLGIDRLAGMTVTDTAGIDRFVLEGLDHPPYRYGRTFLLGR